jgi:transcriptional regulator with GAF, ATPase, and Fis domain
MSTVTRVVTRRGAEVRVVQSYRLEVEGRRAVRVEQPVFRIGTHESNDLVLDDETVSKHHAEVTITPSGYRLVDLSSSNGTYVGELRVEAAVLQQAATLRLGRTQVKLVPTEEEAEVAASARTRFGRLVGRSVAMRELFEQLQAAAGSDSWVLIEGETGVGKELVAESVHQESRRAAGPYVVVDCGALVGELIEAELFGHVKGAFTGADQERKGLLELAHGGTVFLDEVGELPLPVQAKLSGVLGRGQVKPVGATRARPIDVRVIAATNKSLAREVNERRFRADLYYRLAVVQLRVPPLRERLDDIPLLVQEFQRELRARTGTEPVELSTLALGQLAAQPWPGNVRELRSTVERALENLGTSAADPLAERSPFTEARERFCDDFSRAYLTDVLTECGLNISAAARRAGVERRNFARLLERYRVDVRALKRR